MKPEGFPKEERVLRSEDFTRILQGGARVRGRYLSAFWLPDAGDGRVVNRAGVAAGKKLGNAVVRSRLKRRLREAYRRNKRKLPCRGISIIFVASPRMIGRSAREVETDLCEILETISTSSA